MTERLVGVIGGSGLYAIEGLTDLREAAVDTPYGKPSDAVMLGTLAGVKLAFLPRHGRAHRISPSEINYRANLYALKALGVEQILSVSAVGSMKESLAPGEVVIVDQFIDRTFGRRSTFFSDGIVAHVSFADPVCPVLVEKVASAARAAGAKFQKGGTYVCIEGPMFSSRAESHLYRSWGVDVIGMTNYQEAKLAREAEICYVTMAMVTDYDCWHQSHENVDALAVLKVMERNVGLAKQIIKAVVPTLSAERRCPCATALQSAIVTRPENISREVRERLAPIIGR